MRGTYWFPGYEYLSRFLSPPRRILFPERREHAVKLGVPPGELDRLHEEVLGCDREELRRMRRAVLVDERAPAAVRKLAEPLVFALEHALPRRMQLRVVDARHPVGVARLGVDLVRKLVKHDV